MFYRKFSMALCAGLMAIALGGCEQEGPAERAGEKVDEAVGAAKGPMEQTGEAMDKAAEKTGEAMEEAGEKMQEGH
ncbi:MAG: hypothetical protein ACRERD_31990 [Candidatus Binatia bacterium]